MEGFLHNKFEDFGLYLGRDHADFLIAQNALWVSYAKKPEMQAEDRGTHDLQDFDEKYVSLEGTFKIAGHGHRGLFAGELHDVSRILELKRWYGAEPNKPLPVDAGKDPRH